MKYALLFSLLGVGCLLFGFSSPAPWIFVWLWPGLSFLFVGAAYFTNRPGLLGKRRDGTLRPLPVLLLLPYFLVAWASWHVFRLASSERAHDEVAPGIWVARRPLGSEALPSGVALVVDLTAEFAAAPALRHEARYACAPALDASVPSEADFAALMKRLMTTEGGLYIHCAFGHGRSAMVAAAVMVARGLTDVASVEARMRSVRPGVKMNSAQRGLLARWASSLATG